MNQIFSVTQVNSYIRRIFDSDFALKKIKIKGEVSNCKYHSSGHIYFTLKDGSAAIRCVMFSSYRPKGLSFRLEDGQQVVAAGSIRVFERDGTYQLYASSIERDGLGLLYQQYEERKAMLAEKGYFDFERKKELPPFPKRIGVVTALTGAAIEDIRSVARRRNPYLQLYLYPARVQGAGAAEEIAAGIRFFDRCGVDIIIIGRGGGSIEDLWAFNELEVADAIYEARTPIISGTGHEVDMTIADYCADVRAATPSAACELAIPDIFSVMQRLDHISDRFRYQMEARLLAFQQRAAFYGGRLAASHPREKLLAQRMEADRKGSRLHRQMENRLLDARLRAGLYAERLHALSPTARLRGGYAFVSKEGGVPVACAGKLREGQRLLLTFSDGEADVRTEAVRVREEENG